MVDGCTSGNWACTAAVSSSAVRCSRVANRVPRRIRRDEVTRPPCSRMTASTSSTLASAPATSGCEWSPAAGLGAGRPLVTPPR